MKLSHHGLTISLLLTKYDFPMKILFISDVYFPRVNGVSTSIRTFMTQLRQQGHQVDLIAPDYEQGSEPETSVTRVAARTLYFDPEDRLMKYSAVLQLAPALKAEGYDLLHIHTPFVAHYAGLKLARLLNIPCVETYHTFFEDYLHHYLPWIPQLMARAFARLVSKRQCNAVQAIVAPSQPMLNVLKKYGVQSMAAVIPTGLEPSSFAAADEIAFKQKYGIPSERPVLLYLGRVAFEKNIAFLLKMLQQLISRQPEVLLVIAGEGPAETSLRDLAKSLQLDNHIQFIGYLDRHTELNACYRSASIFVFASKSETQGLVLLEAMAQAVSVVAIAELGTASILIEGEGALIAPDNTAQFAEKVDYLLTQPAVRRQLGERAKQYAQTHWAASVQAANMLTFYEQVKADFCQQPSSGMLINADLR